MAARATPVEQKIARARAELYLLLHGGPKMEVPECETAHTIWEKLRTAYQARGISKQVEFVNELLDLKLELCSDIEDYISRFT